jgi:molecular chaperone GrpE
MASENHQSEAQQTDAEATETARKDEPEKTPESVEEQTEELEQAQQKVKEYWERILRLQAQIDNNRKRCEREVEQAHKYAVKNFVEDLLPVTDSLELGIQASQQESATLETIREGMQMTMDLFKKILGQHGIEEIHPVGEKFNPEHHQAMSQQESNEHEPNTVLSVMQKGYLLNDRLVRPAMVVVSKAKSSSE